jgi:hypothetical protein
METAAMVAAPNDDIGNLLVDADWIESYVKTGRLPEVESEQSAITGGIVEAA